MEYIAWGTDFDRQSEKRSEPRQASQRRVDKTSSALQDKMFETRNSVVLSPWRRDASQLASGAVWTDNELTCVDQPTLAGEHGRCRLPEDDQAAGEVDAGQASVSVRQIQRHTPRQLSMSILRGRSPPFDASIARRSAFVSAPPRQGHSAQYLITQSYLRCGSCRTSAVRLSR